MEKFHLTVEFTGEHAGRDSQDRDGTTLRMRKSGRREGWRPALLLPMQLNAIVVDRERTEARIIGRNHCLFCFDLRGGGEKTLVKVEIASHVGDASLLKGGYELVEIVGGQRRITTATEVQVAMQGVVE